MTTTLSRQPETGRAQANGEASSADTQREFAELVAAHHSGLRIYISSLGVSAASVDDVAHEALLIAFRKYGQERIESFGAWVRDIARKVLSNDRRKRNRRYAILNETVTEFFIATDPYSNLADEDELEQRRQALRACLQQLPPKNRKIVTTRYHDEVEAKAIAKELGMQASAVRQRLVTARRALRKCIAHRLGGDE